MAENAEKCDTKTCEANGEKREENVNRNIVIPWSYLIILYIRNSGNGVLSFAKPCEL